MRRTAILQRRATDGLYLERGWIIGFCHLDVVPPSVLFEHADGTIVTADIRLVRFTDWDRDFKTKPTASDWEQYWNRRRDEDDAQG